MSRLRLPVALVAVVAGVTFHAAGAFADTALLNAKFAQDNTFTMTTASGAPLGSPSPPGQVIPAGYYAIVVDDTAEIGSMTFHLSGPGVDLRTTNDEGADSEDSYYVTFQPNSVYSYSDAVNPNLPPEYFSTSGTLVGSAPPGTGTNTTPGSTGAGSTGSGSPVGTKTGTATASKTGSKAATVARGTLVGTVTKTGTTLRLASGKVVSKLETGRYTLVVHDSTKKDGFTLRGVESDPIAASGVAFTGTKTIKVTLLAGQWLYYATLGTRSHYFHVTA